MTRSSPTFAFASWPIARPRFPAPVPRSRLRLSEYFRRHCTNLTAAQDFTQNRFPYYLSYHILADKGFTARRRAGVAIMDEIAHTAHRHIQRPRIGVAVVSEYRHRRARLTRSCGARRNGALHRQSAGRGRAASHRFVRLRRVPIRMIYPAASAVICVCSFGTAVPEMLSQCVPASYKTVAEVVIIVLLRQRSRTSTTCLCGFSTP